jgi:membrane associated rhomboid family serine protease
VCVAIFGTLLERRHGSLLVLALWLLSASAARRSSPASTASRWSSAPTRGRSRSSAPGWCPVLLARRARPDEDDDADMLGVLVLGLVVAALPFASPLTSALASTWGVISGVLVGLVLARARPR